MAQTSISLGIGASIITGFASAFNTAQSQMGQLGQTWRKTKAQLSKVEQFKTLKTHLAQTETQLSHAKQKVVRLRQAMQQSPKPTKKLKQALAQAEREANRLSQTLDKQRQKLMSHRREMKAAGLATHQLAEQTQKLQSVFERSKSIQQSLQGRYYKHQALKSQQQQLHAQVMGLAALGYSVAAPIRVAVDFEQSIAKLGAITQSTQSQLEQLSVTAQHLGRTTQFSASEAAQAMTFLGMAGFKTNQILQVTPGLLDLAQASGSDLGQTADIASNILSGFGLKANQMSRVGDVLSKTFTSSNVTLEMLGETMKYVAPAAASAGASIEEVAAMAGLLGNVGIQASQAGTALRMAFIRLAKPPRMAKDAMDELGLSIKDAQGNMRSMPDILQEIALKTQDLGQADKLALMTKLFGTEAASAMIELSKQAGSGALDKYVKQLQQAHGITQKMAKQMGETTHGALKQLGSALESVAISVGSVVLPTIASMAKWVASVSASFADFAQTHPTVMKGLVMLTGGLVAFRVGAWMTAMVINSFKLSLSALILTAHRFKAASFLIPMILGRWQTQAKTLVTANSRVLKSLVLLRTGVLTLGAAIMSTPIGWIVAAGAALVAAGIAVYKYWTPIKAFFGGVAQGMQSVLIQAGPLGKALIAMGQAVGSVFQTLGHWVGLAWEAISGFFEDLFTPIQMTQSALEGVSQSGQKVGQVLGQAFVMLLSPVNFLLKGLEAIWQKLTTFTNIKLGGVWGAVMNWFETGTPKSVAQPAQPKAVPLEKAQPHYQPLPKATTGAVPTHTINKVDNSTLQITVHQQPGESGEDFAQRVADAIEQHKMRQAWDVE